jgi:heat shock protein HslJ
MMRWLSVAAIVAGLSGTAAAQEARKFPMGQTFKAISISGFDVQNAGITLTVSAEAQSNRLVGSGNAGCNTWNATVVLREDQVDIMTIATTRKMCSKARMTTEQAFLTSLKSAQRWRIDEKGRLILEGEAARLLLTPVGAAKQPGKKPAK